MEQPIISTSFFDEEWEPLSKMFSTDQESDFMLQLLSSNGSCDHVFEAAPSVNMWPVVSHANMENFTGFGVGESSFLGGYDEDGTDYTNFQHVPQESSYSTSASDNNSVCLSNLMSHGFYLANDQINIFQVLNHDESSNQSMEFCAMEDKKDNSTSVPAVIDDAAMTDNVVSPRGGHMDKGKAENQLASTAADSGSELQLKRKFDKAEKQIEAEEEPNNESAENPKKKPRAPRNAQKSKRNVQPKPKKNNQKAAKTCKDDEENNAAQNNGQSSCSYSSEDDSKASQESNGGGGEGSENKEPALNLNGKARASRGSATDPQSLYARRRRERINERLRILQNLIPNGTKVDISTMLEEAVHYVKFLQLQIKLLSSDDMWMYAPIVYNGLDFGLFGRMLPTQ